MGLAAASSIGLGMPNLPVARVIGHPGVQSKEMLERNVLEVTLEQVLDNLLKAPKVAGSDREPGARDVVVKGGFQEINDYFYDNGLSDGLPIVPPTREKVEQFLRCTDRDPGESLGALLPDSRAATIWSIAVNGVIAGCRPEYMPVLVALIEAMADPAYGVEHSGNTPGGETLIIVNGPIIKQLGFNYTQGVMRDGFRPNTAIGRFWRLYLRNVAGFLPHKNDKATFGNTWRVVVAENEDVLKRIGWEPNSSDFGFTAGDSTVTIARYTGGNHISSVSGATPESMKGNSANTGTWYSGPGFTALPGVGPPLVSATASVRCSGTNCSFTSTSLLPVPRNPETFQVSMISASEAGKSIMRASGAPLGSSRGLPSSRMTQPPMSQAQCWQPLAKGQRPETT